MALLEVQDLVKWYGKRKVVDGVSFEVNAGEVVGLLGANGAGKTTSFRMTTGQIPPNGGIVTFNGQDVTSMAMFRRARLGMGYLTQEQSVFRKLTVEKNLLAILEALPRSRKMGRKLNSRERWARTNEMLERFHLTEVRHTVAARASGGEKRRLEIARCLVCEPLLILLDEPFAAVDPKTTEDIRKNIRELAEQGIGILLTDHNVREVLKITDRSYLLKDGKVVTHGTPQQIINDPVAIREYLGTTFTDNTFGYSPPPSQPLPAMMSPPLPITTPVLPPPVSGPTMFSMEQLFEQEQLRRMLEGLKSAGTKEALLPITAEFLKRGWTSVPVLLEGLERRDSILRDRICMLMGQILKEPIAFDPHAPEEECRRQLIALREKLIYRRAA